MSLLAPSLQLRRALLHPAWLGALGVLAINDHVLKGSGLLPGALTGKLSDVAGLFVAPLLLAVLCRTRTARRWAAVHIAIALVFSAIQVSGTAAHGWSSLMGSIGMPWLITSDPSDLLALPMLIVSYVCVPQLARRRDAANPTQRHGGDVAALGAGLVACVATSPPIGEPFFPSFATDTYIHNANGFDIVVRVRPLVEGVQLDCDVVEEAPGAYLSEALFGNAQSWTLQPNATLAVSQGEAFTERECTAALVDADNLPPSIVFWRAGAPPVSQVEGQGITEGAQGWISISFDDEGRGSYETELDLVFEVEEPDQRPDGACVPPSTPRLAWSDAPSGIWILGEVDEGIDGCVQMDLRTGQQADLDVAGRAFVLCVPSGAFPFASGDRVDLFPTSSTTNEGIRMRALEPGSNAPATGATAIEVTRGSLPEALGVTGVVNSEFSCDPVIEPECGSLVRPASVSVAGGGIEAQTIRVGAPITASTQDGDSLELHLVHATERFAFDPACAPGLDLSSTDLELVAVLRGRGDE